MEEIYSGTGLVPPSLQKNTNPGQWAPFLLRNQKKYCLSNQRENHEKASSINVRGNWVDSLFLSLFTPLIVSLPSNLTAIWKHSRINISRQQTWLINRVNAMALNNSLFHENQRIDWNTNSTQHRHVIWINAAWMWPGNKW